MKKSFLLYIDSLSVLDELTDEQAGKLFKAVKLYQETNESGLDGILNAVFVSFRNQFERDDAKYQSICERNKNNALTRWSAKSTSRTQSHPVASTGYQNIPKDAHNDSDNDNDKKNRGTRFALASPPEDWVAYCKAERPDINPHVTFEGFRDYWIAIAGAKGVKLDWFATWRNWIRNQKQQQRPALPKPQRAGVKTL